MHFDIAQIMVIVKDYDEAKNSYLNQLGFTLVEDTLLAEGKRWISVKPNLSSSTTLVLNKATNEAQMKSVGHQTGGKVLMVLHTTNIEADVQQLKNNGVKFKQELAEFPHGKVVIFEDLYGNLYDLVQPQNNSI